MSTPFMKLVDDQNPPASFDAPLKKIVSYFLAEYPKKGSDFSHLIFAFHGLVQDLKDPSIEIIWFYVAVAFHCSKSGILLPPEKLLLTKNVLHVLTTCSSVSGEVKKVAVIAPILYLLYHLVLNFSVSDPCLSEEIGSVVEELVCYISICCSQYLDGGKQGLNSLGEYFVDLLRVWTLDHVREGHDSDILATFFPILKKEFRLEIISCPGYLAGAVMNETFLLRMCLKIPRVLNQEDSQRYMLNVAIQTIKGFQNFHFIDMLLKTLLEPSLPVTALLCSEDARLLQKVLYDAVVLVDYSFYFGRWSHSADSHSKKLALLWLLVADRAIQFARSTNDQATAVKYLNAFGESQIVTEIIKWARIQAGIKEPNCIPNNLTPPILIEWLLILEDQGIRIFDGSSFLRAKALVSKSRMESGWPYLMIDGKNNDGYTFVCDAVVNKDQGMGNPSNNTFCLMSPGFDSGKKRKEAFCDPRGSQVKHAKHDSLGSSNTKGKFSPFSRGSEVIIIVSDDDMEDE